MTQVAVLEERSGAQADGNHLIQFGSDDLESLDDALEGDDRPGRRQVTISE